MFYLLIWDATIYKNKFLYVSLKKLMCSSYSKQSFEKREREITDICFSSQITYYIIKKKNKNNIKVSHKIST